MAHKKSNTLLRSPHVPLDTSAIFTLNPIERALAHDGHACPPWLQCGLEAWECAIVYGPTD